MTRTRTYAFIAAAAALAAFPVAAPAVADQLQRESAAVDGRPVPTSSDDDSANVAVPPAPRNTLDLARMTPAQERALRTKQNELRFLERNAQLGADAPVGNVAPPAPVDPSVAGGTHRVTP